MVFSSVIFIFAFLPALLAAYFIIPNRTWKNFVLLAGSLVFYGWGAKEYIFLMLVSIIINYIFGLLIDEFRSKAVLVWGIIANLELLFYFKYLNFFIDCINPIPGINIRIAEITLPIGISFFTFQGMTYIIDLHKEKVPVQKNPFKVALYISLFPQLIAGPIVRYADVYEAIDNRRHSLDEVSKGLVRFSFGLAKKVMLANVLGEVSAKIFANNYTDNTVAVAWVGAICYSLQIFFDFSGYSDMAIGLGRILGFKFPENFDHPYISKSISEFWRRWHMSLSGFFRDYVYIPMGGSRNGNVYLHLAIVFLLTGIWHGANWTFIVWGIWHGCFILGERVLKNKGKLKENPITWLYTIFVVILGWVMFNSPDVGYGFGFIGRMFGIVKADQCAFTVRYYLNNWVICILIFAIAFCMPLKEWLKIDKFVEKHEIGAEILTKVAALLLLTLSCLNVVTGTYNPFIYFQF